MCPWELIYRVTLCAGGYFHWFVLLSLIVGLRYGGPEVQHTTFHEEKRMDVEESKTSTEKRMMKNRLTSGTGRGRSAPSYF